MQKIFEAQTSQTLETLEPTDPEKNQFQLSYQFLKTSSQSKLLQKIIESSKDNDIRVYKKTIQFLQNMLQSIEAKQKHYYKQNLQAQFFEFISYQQESAQGIKLILENSSQKNQNYKNINKIAYMNESSNQILQTLHNLLSKVSFFRKNISITKEKIKNRQYSIREKSLVKKNKKQYLSHLVLFKQLKNKINRMSWIKVNKIYLNFQNQQIQTIKASKQEFQDLILESSKTYHELEELYFRNKLLYTILKDQVLKLMIQILIFRMTLKHVTFLKNMNQVNDAFYIMKLVSQQYFNCFESYQVNIKVFEEQQHVVIEKKKHSLQHRTYLKCKKFANLIEYIKFDRNSCKDLQEQYWLRMESYFLKEVQGTYHVNLQEINKIGSLMQITPQTQAIYQKFKCISLQNFTTYYFQELQNLRNSQQIDANEIKLILYDFTNKFKWIIEHLNKVKYQNDAFKQLSLNPNLELFEIAFMKIIQPLINIFIETELIEIKSKFQDIKDLIMQYAYNKNFKYVQQCCHFVSYENFINFIFSKFAISSKDTKENWKTLIQTLKRKNINNFCFCKSFQKNNSCKRETKTKKFEQKGTIYTPNQENELKSLELLLKFKNQHKDNNVLTQRQNQYFYQEKLIQKQQKCCKALDIKKIQDYFEQKSLILQSISKFWSHKFQLNKSCEQIEGSDLQCIQFLNQFTLFFSKFTDFIIERQIKKLSNQEEQLQSYIQVFSMVIEDIKNLENNKKQSKKKIVWEQWDDLIQKIYSLTIKINSRQHKKWLILKSCLCIQYYKSIKEKLNKKSKKQQNQISIFRQLLNITDAHYKHKFQK